MLRHLFDELGLTEPSLEINSLGCPECRPLYRETLQAFLRDHDWTHSVQTADAALKAIRCGYWTAKSRGAKRLP